MTYWAYKMSDHVTTAQTTPHGSELHQIATLLLIEMDAGMKWHHDDYKIKDWWCDDVCIVSWLKVCDLPISCPTIFVHCSCRRYDKKSDERQEQRMGHLMRGMYVCMCQNTMLPAHHTTCTSGCHIIMDLIVTILFTAAQYCRSRSDCGLILFHG